MRRPASWMVPVDDRLLEVFRDYGNLTPRAASRDGLVERAPLGSSYASERCEWLHKYGLLRQIDSNLYCLTCEGHEYLQESLDANDLDPINEADVDDEDE